MLYMVDENKIVKVYLISDLIYCWLLSEATNHAAQISVFHTFKNNKS